MSESLGTRCDLGSRGRRVNIECESVELRFCKHVLQDALARHGAKSALPAPVRAQSRGVCRRSWESPRPPPPSRGSGREAPTRPEVPLKDELGRSTKPGQKGPAPRTDVTQAEITLGLAGSSGRRQGGPRAGPNAPSRQRRRQPGDAS